MSWLKLGHKNRLDLFQDTKLTWTYTNKHDWHAKVMCINPLSRMTYKDVAQ
jgi:hypothetical protein